MVEDDVPGVHKLLTDYLSNIKLHVQLTEEEVAYFLLPRKDVIYSYVVVNP